MTSVYNKIHRLKRQPGWTWDRFLTEIERRFPAGIDEKTLYTHYRQPHKKATRHITKVIDTLHNECFPDPFPETINALMRLYNNLTSTTKYASRDKDIEALEFFLQDQLTRESSADKLRIARLNWLLGNIQFDRIPCYRDNGMPEKLTTSQQKAIGYYQNSVSAIEEHNLQCPREQVGAAHLYKARHNILACYLNAVPQERRSQDPAILRYLKESSFIANSKQTLEVEPFQWGIARNGLRFSSLLNNPNDVEYFFTALIKVSPRFLDLDYRPLSHGPISAGTDFHWAIEKVLTPSYLERLKQQTQLKKEYK